MGLITKEVMMRWHSGNKKLYLSKNYNYTKMKDEFLVKIEDLTIGSHAEVDIECDGCGKILKGIKWQDYLKQVRENGNYYCQKCAKAGFKKWVSFEEWCINNHHQDVLNRWDYELNNKLPSEITYGNGKKYYFKCPKGLHKSELKHINSFTSGENGVMNCKQCNSFKQWCIENNQQDILYRWDYELNKCDPDEIDFCSSGINNNGYYFKCQNGIHSSELKHINSFVTRRYGMSCTQCNTLGYIFPQVINIWSNKNKKSPYEYTSVCAKHAWWKCPNGKHEDYYRKISVSNMCDFTCPECVKERNESFLQEKVRLYLESLNNYTILHENKCTIIAQNPKIKNRRGRMPFDNEIKELKLIIEVHGKQHYEICGFHYLSSKRNNTTPEYEFHMLKVRDRYKRMFAKSKINNYHYLEIPYWTDDKDETWNNLIDDKINEINEIKYIVQQNKSA